MIDTDRQTEQETETKMATELFSFQQQFRIATLPVLVTVGKCESQRLFLAAHKLHDVTELVQKLLDQRNKTTCRYQKRIFLHNIRGTQETRFSNKQSVGFHAIFCKVHSEVPPSV